MPTTRIKKDPRGRPTKPDKSEYGQITCVLRNDMIERLREGANSKHFGEFLQYHLDRYPPPTHDEYLWLTQHKEYWTTIKRKKVPVIYSEVPVWKTEQERIWNERQRKEDRKRAREARRFAKLSPKDQKWERFMNGEVK